MGMFLRVCSMVSRVWAGAESPGSRPDQRSIVLPRIYFPPLPDPELEPAPAPVLPPDELPDFPLPEPSICSGGLIFPEDSACPFLLTESCLSPWEPDFSEPPPFPSVTLGGVPPLECCALDGSPVKAIKPPATMATLSIWVVFMMSSF